MTNEKSEKTEIRETPRKSSAVAITLIICAAVVVMTIIWAIFATFALNKSVEIVNDLPENLPENVTIQFR